MCIRDRNWIVQSPDLAKIIEGKKSMVFEVGQKMTTEDFFSRFADDLQALEKIVEIVKKGTGAFPYREFFTFVFPRLVRNQSIDKFLMNLTKEFQNARLDRFPFNLNTTKLLIHLLIFNSTPHLQVILLGILMQYNPLPILMTDIRTLGMKIQPKYEVLSSLYWTMKPMPALFAITIGNKNPNKILNNLFGTNFEQSNRPSDYDLGSVDIQFDQEFKDMKRGFSVIRTDEFITIGNFEKFAKLCSMYLIILPEDEVKENIKSIETVVYEKMVRNSVEQPLIFVLVTHSANRFEESQILKSRSMNLQSLDQNNFGFQRKEIQVLSLPAEEVDDINYKHIFGQIQQQIIEKIAEYCNCLLYTSPSPRDS
eukprot:TRINITY_DN3414_c0_g2_i3.p1 TRINITY_DN3414_c0_g2~~TRINITY_DN3414_c0_g2_i3.p1  ORF type:complete len:367 (-),score=56.28 TRINITY_DN3414_c0_g2_i3:38-1138(-)